MLLRAYVQADVLDSASFVNFTNFNKHKTVNVSEKVV